MWIEDQDNELINLQHIAFIRCEHLPKSSKVVAIDINETVLTIFVGTDEKAEAYMEWLSMLVHARSFMP